MPTRRRVPLSAVAVSSDAFAHAQGESQDQVQKNLESLPLYSYMEVEVTPLSKM